MDKHIRYLLSEGNRVEVPGLGVFTAHYISSQILREQHLILPPRKQVIFTDAEKAEENNSFCHLVMKAEQIDHQAFKTQLESYLNKVYQHIEQHGYYEIPGIGLLKRNAAGKLVLENDTDYNLLNSSYGLPKLFAHPVATQKASVNFETQPQPTSAKIPSSGQQTASKAITREIVLEPPLVAGNDSLNHDFCIFGVFDGGRRSPIAVPRVGEWGKQARRDYILANSR